MALPRRSAARRDQGLRALPAARARALLASRAHTSAERLEEVGYEFCHAIVDDHSRLAYCELQPDERAATVTAFMARALEWFAERGSQAKRVMSDNAWAYTRNRSLAQLLQAPGVRHLVTEPYRPRTNGTVERYHQTMAREWAYGMTYASDRHRAKALPHWLAHYNERRPHSTIEANRQSAALTTSTGRTPRRQTGPPCKS